jgi:hypothetical protein
MHPVNWCLGLGLIQIIVLGGGLFAIAAEIGNGANQLRDIAESLRKTGDNK